MYFSAPELGQTHPGKGNNKLISNTNLKIRIIKLNQILNKDLIFI